MIFSTVCSSLGIFNFQYVALCPSVLLTYFQGLYLISGGYLLLLVFEMSFCRTFDYVLELFPFVLLLCCYLCATLSFFFHLLSISFLALFILYKLSSVEPLLNCVGHSLMINFCPCQFCSGNYKSCSNDVSVSLYERASVRTCLFF